MYAISCFLGGASLGARREAPPFPTTTIPPSVLWAPSLPRAATCWKLGTGIALQIGVPLRVGGAGGSPQLFSRGRPRGLPPAGTVLKGHRGGQHTPPPPFGHLACPFGLWALGSQIVVRESHPGVSDPCRDQEIGS